MAELRFFEDLNRFVIGLEIESPVARELQIFSKNLIASTDIFKVKVKGLIDNLKSRDLSDEDIVAVLLDDFDNNGEIFGGLKRGLTRSAEELLVNVENETKSFAWQEEGFDERETWIAVLVNTCQDCFPRHGVTLPHSIWVQRGLPGSGFSVCKQNDQCQLVPVSIALSKKELQEPIKRVRGKIREIARAKKKKGQIKNVRKYVSRKLGNINNTKEPIRSQYRKDLPGFKR